MSSKEAQSRQKIDLNARDALSRALHEMARRELKEFKAQSDEAFLIRAEMDKKLTSL